MNNLKTCLSCGKDIIGDYCHECGEKVKPVYQVLSPDGFEIGFAFYNTLKEARTALKDWIAGYKAQGYYSQTCYNGYVRKIELKHLKDYCEIIKI